MKHLRLCIVGWLLLAPVVMAIAASEDFLVRQLVGEDTVAPTTPTILSADPIATTQIDLSWSTSTDNYLLSGYRVFRDATQIATTTQTSFSDTGLSADTLYTYTVNAFDSFGNTSSTSAPVSTTTPAVVVATTTPTTTTTAVTAESSLRSSSGRVDLETFSIETQTKSALFKFKTRVPSRFTLRWGRTSTYDGGYIINDVYSFSHRTVVGGLEPGTVYEYELIGYNDFGQEYPLRTGRFTTESIPDATPPANVRDLSAQVIAGGVQLSWTPPRDADFVGVRVLRNPFFYPTDPNDGYLVYDGSANAVFDEAPFVTRDLQYYTVFSYDENGNVSSGAVVWVTAPGAQVGVDTGGTPATVPSVATLSPATTTPIEPPVKQQYERLQLSDIQLRQGDRSFMLSDDAIELALGTPFTIAIPYEAVPEHLKSIVVDVTDGTTVRSYLLRITPDQTAYEAVLPGVDGPRSFTLTVQVYDYLLRVGQSVSTTITFSEAVPPPRTTNPMPVWPDRIILTIQEFWWVLATAIMVGVLLLLLVWRRRRQNTEDNS